MEPWEQYAQAPAATGQEPWEKYAGATKTQLAQPSAIDSFTSGAYAPFKPIVDNTLESLKNTADQTGEAISEPMLTNPNEPGWIKPIDATMRGIGKIGNALGGAYGAVASPLVGALSASAEPALPAVAKGISSVTGGDASKITPEQYHGVAMQTGSDLANAVMLGKAGMQGEANIRQQQGLPPVQSPADPLQPVYDKLNAMSSDNRPRAGFMESNSSDPMQTPETKPYTPADIKAGAVKYYESSEAKGGMLTPEAFGNAIAEANKKAGFQSEEGRTFAGDNVVTQTLDDLSRLQGKPVSLKGAGEIDDTIGDRISAAFRSGNDDQAVKLMKIRDSLRAAYKKAGESDMVNPNGFADWRTGDQLWSAYRSADDVQRIIENGERADVPSTAIKNGFKAFIRNDGNLASFTAEERTALTKAADTGIVTAALKGIGSKIITGVAGGTAGFAGGGIAGSIAGSAVGQAAGYPFRAAATALQRGSGKDVINMIGKRPEVQAALKNQEVLSPTPSPPASPLLALPAPKETISVDAAGRAIPMTPATRDALGQSPSTTAEQRPSTSIENANNAAAAARAKTAALFEKAEREFNAAKQIQMEKLFQSNTMSPQEMVATAAKRFQEAGLPIGDVGQALLRFITNQQGSMPMPKFTALYNAAKELAANPAYLPAAAIVGSIAGGEEDMAQKLKKIMRMKPADARKYLQK